MNNKRDKVFKNGPSKICGRQTLKNLKGYCLLKAVFQTFTWSILECFVPNNKSKIFRLLSKTQLNQTDFNEMMNAVQDDLQAIILSENNIDDALESFIESKIKCIKHKIRHKIRNITKSSGRDQ